MSNRSALVSREIAESLRVLESTKVRTNKKGVQKFINQTYAAPRELNLSIRARMPKETLAQLKAVGLLSSK